MKASQQKPEGNCPHTEWYHGHCAEMSCSNYVNKCPEHGTARPESGVCPL